MTDFLPRPSLDDLRAALNACFPGTAGPDLDFYDEGWDNWLFHSGGLLFRVPKHDYAVRWLPIERRLLDVLAPRLPAAVPRFLHYADRALDGRPLAAYAMIEGTPAGKLPTGGAPRLGRPLGEFLAALHAIPVEAVAETGIDVLDGEGWYRERAAFYERVRAEVYALLTPEQRDACSRRFETFLSDPQNFSFRPSLVHGEVIGDHLIVGPDGRLAGVIDFQGACVGDPAMDFALLLHGELRDVIGALGATALLRAYGPMPGYQDRARFYASCIAFHHVLGGIELGREDAIQTGLRILQARLQAS